MITIERQAIVPYSSRQMYDLVDGVEHYPEFLPWCSGSELVLREERRTVGTIRIDYRGVRQQLTTDNQNIPGERIELALVRGPFREFRGVWQFVPLGDAACRVELSISYQLASPILGRLMGSAFEQIANSLVDSFVGRADEVYGT
jgi:ribosome-associated toxin RatA of RatAB toxin-antitoxin module